jgi:PAS domain S-box-containing protein
LRLVHPIDVHPGTGSRGGCDLEIREDAFTIRMATLLWNLSPAGILLSDENGFVVAVNYRLCSLLGFPQEEIEGKRLWYEWHNEEDRANIETMYSNLAFSGTLARSKHRLKFSGGFVRTTSGRTLLLTVVEEEQRPSTSRSRRRKRHRRDVVPTKSFH